MALPRMNEVPQYSLKVPSTGKTIRYRPYVVREEKILMSAHETNNPKQMLLAITDVIKQCCEISDKEHAALSTFDVEYIFTQLRSKSVGETTKVGIVCEHTTMERRPDAEPQTCGHANEVEIDLAAVRCNVEQVNGAIKLSDTVSVKMRYPSFLTIANAMSEDGTVEQEATGYDMLIGCLESVQTPEENLLIADQTRDDIIGFLESLTDQQTSKLSEYINKVPYVKIDVAGTCAKCGTEFKKEIRGLPNFF